MVTTPFLGQIGLNDGRSDQNNMGRSVMAVTLRISRRVVATAQRGDLASDPRVSETFDAGSGQGVIGFG